MQHLRERSDPDGVLHLDADFPTLDVVVRMSIDTVLMDLNKYKHGVTATTQLLSKLRESGDAADGDRAETTVSPFLEKTQVRLHVFNGLF